MRGNGKEDEPVGGREERSSRREGREKAVGGREEEASVEDETKRRQKKRK